MPDVDAQRVAVWRAIDGDTVETSVGRVRLVGYDAWEWDEPRGPEARYFLNYLCGGTDYLDVDDLEPRDRYGRILGYLWCGRVFEVGGIYYTAYASVQKAFLLVRPDLVKRPLYIPPDEHPYWHWLKRFTVAFDRPVKLVVLNTTSVATGRIFKFDNATQIVLTCGVYKVYIDGYEIANLTSCQDTKLSIEGAPATTTTTMPTVATVTETVTVTTTVTRPITVTRTETLTVTKTETSTVTKTATQYVTTTATVTQTVYVPYVDPISYVVLGVGVVLGIVGAVALAKRR